ncbi:MAG: VacJ family lipoprotein [Desulfobacterales bacterium]
MKKLWPIAALMFFFILFVSNNPASAFNEEATLYLAQAAQAASDKPSDTAGEQAAQDGQDENDDEDEYYDEDEYGEEETEAQLIPDPWIEMNRGLYTFNDKLYFWLLKPVSRGYGFIVPQELRQGIRNAFYNIRFPVRFINCLLQGKISKSGDEFGRFFINTTVGCLGLLNPAANYPRLQPSPEDLGQTFAVWGFGSGAYLMLPFFGPSSLRDGLGRIGDTVIDPLYWFFRDDIWLAIGIRAGETVNDTSLRIGEYEALKEAALDPYIMIRNAWVQNRNKLIAE